MLSVASQAAPGEGAVVALAAVRVQCSTPATSSPQGRRALLLVSPTNCATGCWPAVTSSGDTDRALVAGFLVGDDRALPPGVAADFRAAGLSHLLVVSGANVTLALALAGPPCGASV